MVDYTYSFARNITWPGERDTYEIKVITQDRALTEAFEELANTKKLRGKKINVSFSNYISIPERVDILFVSGLYNGALQSIIDRITGKPILIITEGSPDQQYVMINFLRSQTGTLAFEFNRANINNQNLKIAPDFDLLGGTEIDVAKLYRQVRDSVRAMEQRSKAVQERMDSLNVNTAVAMKIARDQLKQLDEQRVEIARRQAQLDRQSKVLDSLTVEFRNSQIKLDSVSGQLAEREEQLAVLGEEIVQQQASIAEGDKTLKEQEALIKKRNEEIEERESQLQQMVTIVDTQQDTLVLLILFSVFLVVVLIFAYRAYQARRRDARKLNQQKEELKELLDELQSAQNQLVQSEKMASLGTLTAGIAHEINNAINYVYSGIHVLDSKFAELKPIMQNLKGISEGDQNLEGKVQEILKQKDDIEYDSYESVVDTMIRSIRVGAERTINIVKGLRTFSHAQEESMSEIDIHEDIDVALLFLKNKIGNITIETDLANELPTMYGYSGQVGQAILNIIGNAIDACGDKKDGKINIRTQLNNDKIEIYIKDNGSGIKQEDLDKIFDPFYTTKKIGEGTGLGLSITYGIIEKHNGTITVESTLNEGTEFKIELPLNDQPQDQ
ncbi:MAG: hypothetical protein Tsb0034_03440 [Ekhidna sp.]